MPPPSASQPQPPSFMTKKWRTEVCNDNHHWKPLEDWKDVYEPSKPKKQDSERVQKLKANAKEKVKTKVLQKVQDGLSKKLVQLMLEVTSKVLTKMEVDIRDNNNTSGKVTIEGLPQLLNSFNAIVLTFRFDSVSKANKQKVVYLRHLACEECTEFLMKGVKKAEDTTTKLVAMQNELCDTLLQSKDTTRLVAESLVDDLLETARQETAVALASATSVELQQELSIQTESVMDQFVDFIKSLILSQMDYFTDSLALVLKQIFTKLENVLIPVVVEAKKKVGGKQQPSKEMLHLVEEIYGQMQDTITNKVEQLVTMLEAMMTTTANASSE